LKLKRGSGPVRIVASLSACTRRNVTSAEPSLSRVVAFWWEKVFQVRIHDKKGGENSLAAGLYVEW
jgi:hypothetical protein